jgi:hypothetical protein
VIITILKPKNEEVTGDWRKMHSDELDHLCSSANIIRRTKSKRITWAGYVAWVRREAHSTFL